MCPAQENSEIIDLIHVPTEGELPAPGREEIASATDVMSALVKTSKGLRMYLPNNPMLIRYVEDLHRKMQAHIGSYGDYQLELEPFALRYQGSEVYQNKDAKESWSLRMHSDGIRVLHFSAGLGEQELTAFLEIAGFERPNQQDDDVVTRLWEVDLPHISYLLEEDYIGIDTLEVEAGIAASQQGAITELFRTLASTPLHPPRMVPKHLLMLTADEANWLHKFVQADARRSPPDDVINILSAILAGVQELETFRVFNGIVAKLVVELFIAKELGHALRLVRFLGQLLTLGSIAPEQRQLIAGSLDGILCESVLQALQEVINTTEDLSHQELKELLLILGLPSLGSICELLGQVEKLKMRKVIIEVLIELGKENPEVFAPFLSDARWYLVRNVVLVLSLLGNPVALQMIVGLISHKESRIRKEVLGFLEHSQDPKARAYILKFLRDESSSLRIRALRILSKERRPFAFKAVLALTSADEFKTRELAEKVVVYETLGELGSEQMIPLFRDMLLKKHWFKRSFPRESATCAVAGLLKVRHRSALLLLEVARSQGSVEVRGIIDQAMEGVTVQTGTTAA
jgi:hypothetical protein